jgi:hypothetical protein
MTTTTLAKPADTATPAGRPRQPAGRNTRAAQHAIDVTSTTVRFHLGDTQIKLNLPPLDKSAFYVGLAGAAAFGVIEWPIAVITGVGHLLSEDRHNRTLRALGEALDAA